ncbi:hypothetical protein A2335_05110 [Candidatus Peregrinibacteria bacterium RIFOXYB2_FULL_32_7]|nr:MAG: hypothetical protein A2335_05110 [Candidatus Peregrinibacteria bacterium RIFOXYB2_FULL_32_7]
MFKLKNIGFWKKNAMVLMIFLIFLIVFWIWTRFAVEFLQDRYLERQSVKILDRSEEIIAILANEDGFYADYLAEIPVDFAEKLISKEDKYFYYHFGINPVSILRAFWKILLYGDSGASSTITQQLVKILLNNEDERNFRNKFVEILYALSLEMNFEKEEILKMYINTIFFGNNTQGLSLASRLYFDKDAFDLSEEEIWKLLATIPSPSSSNPFLDENVAQTEFLAQGQRKFEKIGISEVENLKKKFQNYVSSDSFFEIKNLNFDFLGKVDLTIDKNLTGKIREIVNNTILNLYKKNVHHAAVVVIKLPENELLAVVGSPDSDSNFDGDQINMAMQSRPIGSTVKPFIYARAFEMDLRPYTLVDDREYKYTTAMGQAHFPKNYDYKYRGIVTLHESLANSLNVPAVKVLEYIGFEDFENLLLEKLEFEPLRTLDEYQFGIALGGLEMNLLQLSHYFSIFGNKGYLKPLKIFTSGQNIFNQNKQIFAEKDVQLVNKILTDRDASSDQFGLVGNLHVAQKNVAVKTGTSREYHDSWTIGYTPDFLVGVWIGNADNTAMDEVSGQIGAGAIWHDAMNLLINSEYNLKTEFEFNQIQGFKNVENIEYGLPNDDFEYHKNLLMDQTLILNPHEGDEFLYENGMQIVLKASENIEWFVNGEFLGQGKEMIWEPEDYGIFKIKGNNEEVSEEISVLINY